MTIKVQAQFHAARMKTGSPIKLALRKKIVPLDAVACAVKAAKDRLPALADITPGLDLGKFGGAATGNWC